MIIFRARDIWQRRSESRMERVLGIGGFYFRARDPEALAQWYATCLGVDLRPQGRETLVWTQQGMRLPLHPGWEPTAASGAEPRNWMLNFRVRDLDMMVRQLRAMGIGVEVDPEDYNAGRFARFADPEGNPVAIWELQGVDARE